ncbi:hypothetical protein DFP73DRAFT_544643 [Morchella snyderi]|nr:hypothetical protein DFP73DRAFT_544643 [Morchella snyderi]
MAGRGFMAVGVVKVALSLSLFLSFFLSFFLSLFTISLSSLLFLLFSLSHYYDIMYGMRNIWVGVKTHCWEEKKKEYHRHRWY